MAEIRFEQGLARLEEIVRLMDRTELPLDEAIRLFEEGIQLSETLNAILNRAEQRVEALVKGPSGSAVIMPLDEVSGDGAA